VDGTPRYFKKTNITGAVRLAEVATADVSYYSGFWFWHKKSPPRKLATNFFELSVFILGVRLKIYLSLQKVRIYFSIYEVTMCFLLYNLLYQFSQFPIVMGNLKLRKHKLA